MDVIQLHGHESNETIRMLRQYTDKTIIRAIRIGKPEDILRARDCEADLVLLDNGAGGTGEAFDWDHIQPGSAGRPFFLAGGLDPENVRRAVRLIRPFGVDVSSGVETDGRKDPEKIRRFVRAVRG